MQDHLTGAAAPAEPLLVAELIAIDGDSTQIDERHATKQPDWTYGATWSGETPVERFTDHRAHP